MVRDSSTLVQRQQLSQQCYSQACVVLQYYAIWRTLHLQGITSSAHGVLDVTRHMVEYFSAKDLEAYVTRDSGMSSLVFLKQILTPGSIVIASSLELIEENRKKYGAALVAGFSVYTDFHDETVHHHEGIPSGKFLGLHAMVLLGTRTDASGMRFHMLQNWWPKKQFVEVSESYLKACGATVYFIETPQTHVPTKFATHSSAFHYQESILDVAEADAIEDI